MMTKSEIQFVRSLAGKKERRQHGLFIVEGAKMVAEAVASDFRVEKIYSTGGGPANAEHISPAEMERISALKTPTDVLALVAIREHDLPPSFDNELVLVLDDIQDPGNLGTILRLADWFGIRNIVCSPATADCYSSKVAQATMGAIFRVNVHYTFVAEWLAGQESDVFGTFLDGENIYDAALPSAGVVVMGNEGKGIGAETEKLVTRRLSIPSYPIGEPRGGESLNVAVATAIVCSEFRRR